MATKIIDKTIDWTKIGTPDGMQLAAGDIVIHKEFDPGTVYVNFVKPYPNLLMVPIAPGTELYTELGPNTSYIKTV